MDDELPNCESPRTPRAQAAVPCTPPRLAVREHQARAGVPPELAARSVLGDSWSPQVGPPPPSSTRAQFHAYFLERALACNRVLNGVHEATSPKLTPNERVRRRLEFGRFFDRTDPDHDSYGGISGTITPVGVTRVAVALAFDVAAPYQMRAGSVFCDVGSGTGRPSFYFAHGAPNLRASLGFDIDPLQMLNARAGQARLARRLPSPGVPCRILQLDAARLDSLCPATHVYMFVGYAAMVRTLAKLLCVSPTVRAVACVTVRPRDLVDAGLLRVSDPDVVRLCGLRMPGGRAYSAFVIPCTPPRIAALRARYGGCIQADLDSYRDLRAFVF